MSTRTRASAAGPLVTLTSGISKRKCCTSPRPRSSTPTTSLIGSSAGTSPTNLRVASSIRALASSAICLLVSSWTGWWSVAVLSDLMTLQQLAPDHHALYLRCALANQQQRGIAIETLDLVLLGVAIASMDAKGLLHAEASGLRCEQLGHAGLQV